MKPIIARAFVGLVIGLSFAAFLFVIISSAERLFGDYTKQPLRLINHAFNFLNAPAEGLSRLWTDKLRMPPRSGLAFIVVPIVAALLQWGIIGLTGGLLWGIKTHLSEASQRCSVWPVLLWCEGGLFLSGTFIFVLALIINPPASPIAPLENNQEVIDEEEQGLRDEADIHYRSGLDFAREGQLDNALAQFREAAKVRPDHSEAYFQAGLIYNKKRNSKAAISCFRMALMFNPDSEEVQQHLEEALEKNGGEP